MAGASPSAEEDFSPFTKAERIQQLNNIDKSLINLLRSAGLALQVLASSREAERSVEDRKKAFQSATDTYLATVECVDVNLRRQIWALEEAGIIIEKKPKESKEAISIDRRPEKEVEGGTGKLDIGWLNSRSGKVGRDKEVELWAQARSFVEGLNQNLDEADEKLSREKLEIKV